MRVNVIIYMSFIYAMKKTGEDEWDECILSCFITCMSLCENDDHIMFYFTAFDLLFSAMLMQMMFFFSIPANFTFLYRVYLGDYYFDKIL